MVSLSRAVRNLIPNTGDSSLTVFHPSPAGLPRELSSEEMSAAQPLSDGAEVGCDPEAAVDFLCLVDLCCSIGK